MRELAFALPLNNGWFHQMNDSFRNIRFTPVTITINYPKKLTI